MIVGRSCFEYAPNISEVCQEPRSAYVGRGISKAFSKNFVLMAVGPIRSCMVTVTAYARNYPESCCSSRERSYLSRKQYGDVTLVTANQNKLKVNSPC